MGATLGRPPKVARVFFADQDGGVNGEPTEFKSDEHRKYDAKVRVPTAQQQRSRLFSAMPLSLS